MHKRLKSAKPTYSYLNYEKDYLYKQYLENQIKFKNNNPNIFFKTPEKFQKTLYFKMNEDFNQNKYNTFRPKSQMANYTGFSNSSTFYKTRPYTSNPNFK